MTFCDQIKISSQKVRGVWYFVTTGKNWSQKGTFYDETRARHAPFGHKMSFFIVLPRTRSPSQDLKGGRIGPSGPWPPSQHRLGSQSGLPSSRQRHHLDQPSFPPWVG